MAHAALVLVGGIGAAQPGCEKEENTHRIDLLQRRAVGFLPWWIHPPVETPLDRWILPPVEQGDARRAIERSILSHSADVDHSVGAAGVGVGEADVLCGAVQPHVRVRVILLHVHPIHVPPPRPVAGCVHERMVELAPAPVQGVP